MGSKNRDDEDLLQHAKHVFKGDACFASPLKRALERYRLARGYPVKAETRAAGACDGSFRQGW